MSKLTIRLASYAFVFVCLLITNGNAQSRQDISLNKNWRTIADDQNQSAYTGFEQASFNTSKWKLVDVPHNWDAYEGYRRLKHGNRHGYAWYRTSFKTTQAAKNKRYFLYFEGVGSYATVWLNGKKVGYHAGGRTTFNLDVTDAIRLNQTNLFAVRADHPAFIKDLPWVCGGCSDEVGFSEGSQPMGIFRPVHLLITNPVRIQPFGVHIWNDSTVSEKGADLNLETEIKDYSGQAAQVLVRSQLLDPEGKIVGSVSSGVNLIAGQTLVVPQKIQLGKANLWSLKKPYLYHLQTQILQNGKMLDQETTPYGIRWISWPIGRAGNNKQFLLNGKPVFINGIAEYEHNMGQSHAFSKEQIRTRVMQVRAAGFNAFRDAHQPHNLEYQKYWDKLGLLWWPQFTAHIWYDTPEFRDNFKALLVDWVKERRNSPSVILWGLQNESKLPTDFAQECSDLIRKLDPTASAQRKITTCNGGSGTDWDVPQNWTGTYGGDPLTYAADIQRQVLIGEYGAWRTTDLHTEGPFIQSGPLSENRMTQLMETKIKLAESVKDKTTGQFFWLLTSHENPGRVQAGEGFREMDRIGPINYKGLFTPWGEPTDVFYLFRANAAPKEKEPMVYIVSHTWPDRWHKPGKKDSICIYSNCDEVELFNDVNGASLGKKKQQGIGTHFQWDGADIKYNVLKAVGFVRGKKVAEDMIVLNHLQKAPHYTASKGRGADLLQPVKGLNYLYRVNCGGPDYTDHLGNQWHSDVHLSGTKTWGSTSWTDGQNDMPAQFGSQRRTFDAIGGTADPKLFQTFRYGRDQLAYHFPLPNGDYCLELYFTEPWYGIGGGMNCRGWRMFDVAINGKTLIKDLDIWKQAGTENALKKVLNVHITDGHLNINFPQVASGQAVISAIAIATVNKQVKGVPASTGIIKNLRFNDAKFPPMWTIKSWLDVGDQVYLDDAGSFSSLPANLYGAEWLFGPRFTLTSIIAPNSFTVTADADVYIAIDESITKTPEWMHEFDDTKTTIVTEHDSGKRFNVYHRRYAAGSTVELGQTGAISPVDLHLNNIIAVVPVNKMERATDLKPSISYKAEKGKLEGDGLTMVEAGGKKIAFFKSVQVGSISWDISTGVADIYTLRVKYLNPAGKPIKAGIKVLAADGTVMKSGELELGTTTADKWKTVETTTGTSINAGNYKVIITVQNAEGLSISGLEVQ